MAANSGSSAVVLALLGNGALTAIKFVAFFLSGSGAMLSEAIHSFADTANQFLLFLGIRRSKRSPDDEYNYGYGVERFIFALLSAVGIFVLGCGVTVYHGVHSLLHPPELELSMVTFGVLGVSVVVEGSVLLSAWRSVADEVRKHGFFGFLRNSTDPTIVAVLFEDAVAVIGVLVAAAGIGLAWWTGNPIFDALGSIIIGLMMGVIAVYLGLKNRSLILGQAIPPKIRTQALGLIAEQPSVLEVRGVRTRVVGADAFKLQADVDFAGGWFGLQHAEWAKEQLPSVDPEAVDKLCEELGERVVESLAQEVDRIEAVLGEAFPRVHFVDLETD